MSLNKIIHQVVSQEGRFTITTIFPLCVCVWWVGGGSKDVSIKMAYKKLKRTQDEDLLDTKIISVIVLLLLAQRTY